MSPSCTCICVLVCMHNKNQCQMPKDTFLLQWQIRCCCPEETEWTLIHPPILHGVFMSSFLNCTEAVSCLGNRKTQCCISQVTLRLSTSAVWELVSWGSFHAPQPKSLHPVIKASGSSKAFSLSLSLSGIFFVVVLWCFFFLWLFPCLGAYTQYRL